ncbi:MAG: hypothetical protein WBK11_09705 [Bacillota bacterium]
MPECRSDTEHMDMRLQLFREMLAVTRDLDDALTIEEVTSDNLSIIDLLVEARESLISRINELDARATSQQSSVSCSVSGEAIGTGAGDVSNASLDGESSEIRDVLQELMVLQKQIDAKLKRHKARAQQRIGEIRKRRASVSGYYDKLVASRPRYVDTRK